MKLRIAFMGTLAAVALLWGCTTNQQTVAYKTLSSVEQTVSAANDGYQSLVIKGLLATNEVPAESALFNKFQASFVLALDAAQFNTNAIAPASLQVEGQDVINFITTIKTKGTK